METTNQKKKTGHLQWEKPHHTWNFGPSQSPVLSTKGYLRFLGASVTSAFGVFFGGATDQENVSKVRIEQNKKQLFKIPRVPRNACKHAELKGLPI